MIGPGTWQAARNGMRGDSKAINQAAQVGQFLATHAITPVYAGDRVWTVAPAGGLTGTPYFWYLSGTGWLPAHDADQPVVLPSGTTAIGRIEVALQAAGNGADLQVTLYPDNGSGAPNMSSPIVSTIIPAAHLTSLSAAGSLAFAGPLATAQSNTVFTGPEITTAWTQPAVSANGSGSFSCPVTSGNWSVLLGGYDPTANAASASVTQVQYLGSGSVSSAMPLPALPQAAWYLCAAATTDTMVVAGGTSGIAHYSSVWTAAWDPVAGTLGAWSAQQSLPAATLNAAMATWQDYAYVVGGSTDGTNANATASVWVASVVNGQVTAWTAGPPLPQPIIKPYAAVIGDWLVVAGGVSASGTVLTSTWYAPVSNGIPGPWQAGPPLPVPAYAFSPNWNLAVTDSAVIIVSGSTSTGPGTPTTQVLSVSPDGPAPEWQLQDFTLTASALEYQVAAYQSGIAGQWEIFGFLPASYATAVLYPVPLISVPLPASGLTPGGTYHIVFHQLGGDTVNNYVTLGELGATTPPAPWLDSPAGSGGPWNPHVNKAIALNVYDQTPGGQPWHLWSDSGAQLTSLVWSGAGNQLLGVLEATQFPSGSPEAALATVTQLQYGPAGLPSGTVQLA